MLQDYALEILKTEENGHQIFLEELLKQLFTMYQAEKDAGIVYKNDDFAKNLIGLYYHLVDHPRFDMTITNFKEKYIMQECMLEDCHRDEEKEGFACMYEYIHHYIRDNELNIYLFLKLHQELFSKSLCPEAGGSFRHENNYIAGTTVETEDWTRIPTVIANLYPEFAELVKIGKALGNHDSSENMMDYIERCIKLKCELVRIHPFFDGNGRTCRALLNVLFKLANIPFVYVKAEEKEAYTKAMNKAIVDSDYDEIVRFYHYKICDSIMELDLSNRLTGGFERSKTLNFTKEKKHQ